MEESSSLATQLAEARARIVRLEQELSERDKQLESVIIDSDKDIVDLRKSFDIETLRRSRVMSEHNPTSCVSCSQLKEEIKKYQAQWNTISKHFHQVPNLLDSMITRTDNLVNSITRLGDR
jgi:predicted AAA+ superfamily ATPase